MRLIKEKFGLEQITKTLISLGLFASATFGVLYWREEGRILENEKRNQITQEQRELSDLYALGAKAGAVIFGSGAAGYVLIGGRKK